MGDKASGDSSSFSRAFLPGLIVGLVIGGLCGAVLPDLLGGGPASRVTHGTGEVSDAPRERVEQPPLDDAGDAANEAVDDATDDAANAVEDAADTTTPPPSDGG